jgi:acetyl esterase/lipase
MICIVPVLLALAQDVKRDVPYGDQERQVLDIYAPKDAKNLPVVFWIHGGGWHMGDKSMVEDKPKLFLKRGLVFVSTNYRLLPKVEMQVLFRDVAKSIGWVHKNIAAHGGDPNRIFVMGHSAGAQLAALMCCDDRYLKDEGVPFSALKGCVPVDGDTYDVPAIVETEETRRRAHGEAVPKFSWREKFGTTPEKLKEYSAVTHVAQGKDIPPFLLLFVADHPYTSSQARRLAVVLESAGVRASLYGARDTNHVKLNDDLGVPGDNATKALVEFVTEALKK